MLKTLWGKRQNLPEVKAAGNTYFCKDDATLHIDYVDENGNLQRQQMNAKDAETLNGASLSTVLNSSNEEVPTSKAVYSAIGEKADKVHTHGSDSITLEDTVTGEQFNICVTNGKLTLVKITQ
jgi:phage-related tail fiber protein